jgi:putative sulfotransferase
VDVQAPGRWIVISTGRCGSTLLSDLIAEDPDTLSVQEFFMSVARWARTTEAVSGAAYWAMLASPKPELTTLFRIGLPPKEVHYPSTGRFAGDMAALPRVLAVTLSKLTDDPDTLYDRAAARVTRFPDQPVFRHHEMFLDVLAELTGKRRWVERSGGSSHLAPDLLRAFPHAKFVYLTRNWADTATSMSRHASFQLIQLRLEFTARYGTDPFIDTTAPVAVPEEMAHLAPGRLTAETLRERGRDVKRYLGLCAFMTNQAEQALVDLAPAHLLRMTYEDLVADPVTELGRLGQFLEFDDWSRWATAMSGRVAAPARAVAAA